MDSSIFDMSPAFTKVFISYSRHDQEWKQQLVKHLRVLESQGFLKVWDDTQITPGNEWCREIERALETATVALLLISANSLTSEFILQREIPVLLKRRSKEGLRIIPIILEPCPWQAVNWLQQLEIRPKGALPLSARDSHHLQEALADIAGEIQALVDGSMAFRKGNDSAPEAVATPRDGLNSLEKLAPRGRAIERVWTIFQLAHGQIILLSDYKDLHDALHGLERLHAGIVTESARFDSDDSARYNLNDHALTLQGISDELTSIAQRGNLKDFELKWLSDIGRAKNDIERAIDERDVVGMRNPVALLHRILNVEPPRINDRLIHVARGLRLESLASELRQVAEPLRTIPSPQEYEDLTKSIDAIVALNERQSALVTSHSLWQDVEIELKRLDASLRHGLTELQISWEELLMLAGSLYEDVQEPWASKLRSAAAELRSAMHSLLDTNIGAPGEPTHMERIVTESFRRYRRLAAIRFELVDKDLQQMCGKLRDLGVSLAALLARLDNGWRAN
jgi:hypothetical protein